MAIPLIYTPNSGKTLLEVVVMERTAGLVLPEVSFVPRGEAVAQEVTIAPFDPTRNQRLVYVNEVLDEGVWTERRRNLWTNPQAVSTGTAFGAPTFGVPSFITDFAGPVTTAYRWSGNQIGTGRISLVPLGAATPDNGERFHISMNAKVSGVAISGQVNVFNRPFDMVLTTNQTQVMGAPSGPIGDLPIDVTGLATNTTAQAAGGVILAATMTELGSIVDITQIFVAINESTGAYFDGYTAPASPNERYRWLGTPHDSPSVYEKLAWVA